MKTKPFVFGDDANRIDAVIGDPTTVPSVTWCLVGHHEVPYGTCQPSPRGHMVCPVCATTPQGQRELREFDPCAGYTERRRR